MSSILIKKISVNDSIADILIEGNEIKKIAPCIDLDADKIINGAGKVAMPSFVNMHTHAAMTLLRGAGEDMALHSWLNDRIWPIEAKLNREMIYWGMKLACLEMIKTGTTAFVDQYWHIDEGVRASEEMGVRSLQPFVILDMFDSSKWQEKRERAELFLEQSASWSSLSQYGIGLHAPYTVSEEMLVWGTEFASKHGLKTHIHISETSEENSNMEKRTAKSPIRYLDSIGVLNENVIAAHCIWIDDRDIEILAKRGVTVVHNINSNLKLASGYKFKYKELRDAGVNVCLGTDGCASSNNLDMLETMKTTALLQKAWRFDPTAMPLDELIELATVNGARALGINSGLLEEGRLADITIVDTDNYAFVPNYSFRANLIYSANSSCVDTVICNGKVLMENRIVAGEAEILSNVRRVFESAGLKIYCER